VISHVNRLFAIASTKLSNVCNGGGVQRPKGIFVECFDAFDQANLDAIEK
jgi:hypothetical protein